MKNVNDGGPAFPSSNTPDHGFYAEGMTLRDYFAAKAMTRLISNHTSLFNVTAKQAYALADEMLKAREES